MVFLKKRCGITTGIGVCRRVGLKQPADKGSQLSNRTKQLYALSVGEEVASNVLKDHNDKPQRRCVVDKKCDSASEVSSFTESERKFLNVSPKGPPLRPQELPQQARESYVQQWLPRKLVEDYSSSSPFSTCDNSIGPANKSQTPSPSRLLPPLTKVSEVQRRLNFDAAVTVNRESLPLVTTPLNTDLNIAPRVEDGIESQLSANTLQSFGNVSVHSSEENERVSAVAKAVPKSPILSTKQPPHLPIAFSPSTTENSFCISPFASGCNPEEIENVPSPELSPRLPSKQLSVTSPHSSTHEEQIACNTPQGSEQSDVQTPRALSSRESAYHSHGTPYGRIRSGSSLDPSASGSAQMHSDNSNSRKTVPKAKRHLSFSRTMNNRQEPDDHDADDPNWAHDDENHSSSSSSSSESGQLEEDDTESPPPKKIARKERRNQNKMARNSGKSYTTLYSNKVVKDREVQPLPKCKVKTCNRLDEETRGQIFKEYWDLQDFDLRVGYIASHVFKMPVKTKRIREESSKTRTCTLRYEFEINSERKTVCKKCFLATLNENDGFVKRALNNKSKSLSGVTIKDRRGKRPSSRKLPEEVLQAVQTHIQRFPKYQSHYSRSHTSRFYLGSDLTITRMYQLYLEAGNPKVSFSYYVREFKKTGLKFKPPHIDTCRKCDTLDQSIKHAFGEDKAQKQAEQLAHHLMAEAAYDAKRADKEKYAKTPSKRVIVFDLQQVLPCPLLSSGNVFYKRQLSVFNLTVFDCSKLLSMNHMWHEGIAGRGANEIASCLTSYFEEQVPPEVDHIIMYSDTCSGQNKNSHVCAAMIATVKNHPSIKIIDQKFLVPGHTHLECDQVHSQIEKKKRKTTCEIHHPANYFNFVRTVGPASAPLGVKEMVRRNFFDYESLLKLKEGGPLVARKLNEKREPFTFAPVQWFRYSKEDPTTVLYKTSLEENEPFKKVSFRRRGKLGAKALQPRQAYNGPHPISEEKKTDLLELLPQINPLYREFYENLVTSKDLQDINYDIMSENVDVAELLLQNLGEDRE